MGCTWLVFRKVGECPTYAAREHLPPRWKVLRMGKISRTVTTEVIQPERWSIHVQLMNTWETAKSK